MKKLTSLALALALLFASVAALAEDQADTKTIKLSLTIPTNATKYEWSIPDQLTLNVPDDENGKDEKNTFTVTVSKLAYLKDTMQLSIIPVTKSLSLAYGDNGSISYALCSVDDDQSGQKQWTPLASSPLNFTTTGTRTVGIFLSDLSRYIKEMGIPSGEYTGDLIFKAEITSRQTP